MAVRYSVARERHERALAWLDSEDAADRRAVALTFMGSVCRLDGDLEAAETCFGEALQLSAFGRGALLHDLADISRARNG
jgi:hypothetical protein